VVVDHLPAPTRAMQEEGNPSISKVGPPVELALEVEVQKSRSNLAQNSYRYIAHLHHCDALKEPSDLMIVLRDTFPTLHWLGHLLGNIDALVVVVIPNSHELFGVEHEKALTILLNHGRNLLPILFGCWHRTLSFFLFISHRCSRFHTFSSARAHALCTITPNTHLMRVQRFIGSCREGAHI
jgi:hypothetical protein